LKEVVTIRLMMLGYLLLPLLLHGFFVGFIGLSFVMNCVMAALSHKISKKTLLGFCILKMLLFYALNMQVLVWAFNIALTMHGIEMAHMTEVEAPDYLIDFFLWLMSSPILIWLFIISMYVVSTLTVGSAVFMMVGGGLFFEILIIRGIMGKIGRFKPFLSRKGKAEIKPRVTIVDFPSGRKEAWVFPPYVHEYGENHALNPLCHTYRGSFARHWAVEEALLKIKAVFDGMDAMPLYDLFHALIGIPLGFNCGFPQRDIALYVVWNFRGCKPLLVKPL